MSELLSREQVERSIGVLDAWLGQEGDCVLLGDLLKHDATQRARIAALEQEHAGCKASLQYSLLDNDKMYTQLATMTVERDQLLEALCEVTANLMAATALLELGVIGGDDGIV